MHRSTTTLAVVFAALLAFSIIGQVHNASALSSVTFTNKATISSINQQFQRVYEDGTTNAYFLDADNTTINESIYNISTGSVTSLSIRPSAGGTTTTSNQAFYAYGNSTSWTQTGTQVTISGGALNFVTTQGGSTTNTQRQYIALPSTLPDSNFVLKTEFQWTARANNPQILTSAVSANTNWFGDGTSNDAIGIEFTHDGVVGKVFIWAQDGTSASQSAGTITLASSTQYYPKLSRLSTTSVQLDVYSDSGYTTPVAGSPVTLTIPNTITSLAILQHSNMWGAGTGNTVSGLVDNDLLTWTGSVTTSAKADSGVFTSNVESDNTVFAVSRNSTNSLNIYTKHGLTTLAQSANATQSSTYYPRDIAQSTTKLYSPLLDSSTQYGTLYLGNQARALTGYAQPSIQTGNATVPAAGYAGNPSSSASSDNIDSAGATVAAELISSTGALVGKRIYSLDLWLSKSGSPTGTATIGTFDASGNVVTTFGTQNVALLTGSVTVYHYQLTVPYYVQAGDRLGIKFTGGDGSNFVQVAYQANDVYDGTNSQRSVFNGSWTDASTNDRRFAVLTGQVRTVVYDGSPDTEYIIFESGASAIRVIKYTSSATLLGTALTHTVSSPFSVIQLTDRVIIQTSSATYQLLKATDAITQIYGTTFPTVYEQPFTVSSSLRTFNSAPALIANTTYAVNYTPSTGASAQTGPIISSVSPPTLTTYAAAKYYFLPTNSLSIEANSATGTTWTIRAVGSQNQFYVTPYSEKLSVSLVQNNTLFSQGVLNLVCDSGTYTVALPYFATGDASDCELWRVTATSATSIGRQINTPFTNTVDLVHTNPMTAYTFNLAASDPTIFTLKSVYGGKVVDVTGFGADGTAMQYYLFGQCYTIEVYNNDDGQTINLGQICANDATTKNINLNLITVPPGWPSFGWNYQIARNFGTTNSTVQFDVVHSASNETTYTANVLTTDSWLSSQQTFHRWYNFTNVPDNTTSTIITSDIWNNQTIFFTVYDGDGIPRLTASSQGKSDVLSIVNTAFLPVGNVFGVSPIIFFIVIAAAIFVRTNSPFGVIVIAGLTGFLYAVGMLDISNAVWGGLITVAALGGLYAMRRY